MTISIVIPVYNEEENIFTLYDNLIKVLKKKYEIIFVDDGSTDRTYDLLKSLKKKDKRVKIIQFISNFGKSAALSAGFKYASGEIIFTMDGDLQDDPEEIPKFIEKINQGYDVVSGWRKKRKFSVIKNMSSGIYNRLTSKITGINIHDFNCGFKAYRRQVIENLKIYGELHRYIPVLAKWKGYKITEVVVKHHRRKKGVSKYGPSRVIKGFFDLMTVKFITTFKSKPLHFFGSIGISCMGLGTLFGVYLSYLRFIENAKIGDRPLLMLAVLLLVMGVQFISMGFLGELMTHMNGEDDSVIRRVIK